MSYEDELTDIKLPKKAYTMIEIAVTNLFLELGIGKYPINPFEIIRKKGYVLHSYSELPNKARSLLASYNLDATSFYDPNLKTFVICYDDTQSIERIRFTLMHEVGHITLGHREESDLAKKMADYFAAYSLAPSPIIMRYHCEDYLEVAETFVISTECAYFTFERYNNWYEYSGRIKDYEKSLIKLFDSVSNRKEEGVCSLIVTRQKRKTPLD